MSLLIALVVAGVGTYLFRISLVAGRERFATPPWLESRLPLVGPSVLAAIVTSSLIVTDGSPAMPTPVEAVAVVAALLAVRRTGNLGAALAVGLPIYWLGTTLGVG